MAFVLARTKEIQVKVVYYGPGLCGKTTNLEYIHRHTRKEMRGELISLSTEGDRTIFFDWLPLDVGKIAGFNVKIQLYTVPGQVRYNATRKQVLRGVDGVVFVVDSQPALLRANMESLQNLKDNLKELGVPTDSVPVAIQYNKQDLANVLPSKVLEEKLGLVGAPSMEASALTGKGVFETLKILSTILIKRIKGRLESETGSSRRHGQEARPAQESAVARPAGETPRSGEDQALEASQAGSPEISPLLDALVRATGLSEKVRSLLLDASLLEQELAQWQERATSLLTAEGVAAQRLPAPAAKGTTLVDRLSSLEGTLAELVRRLGQEG